MSKSLIKPGETRSELRTRLTDLHIKFIDLRAASEPLQSIAEELGIPLKVAQIWNREFHAYIKNTAKLEAESLLRKHRARHRDQIEAYAKIAEKLTNAALKLDVSELRPKDLLTALDTFMSRLRELVPEEQDSIAIERELAEEREIFVLTHQQ
jgi:hypothetical protein